MKRFLDSSNREYISVFFAVNTQLRTIQSIQPAYREDSPRSSSHEPQKIRGRYFHRPVRTAGPEIGRGEYGYGILVEKIFGVRHWDGRDAPRFHAQRGEDFVGRQREESRRFTPNTPARRGEATCLVSLSAARTNHPFLVQNATVFTRRVTSNERFSFASFAVWVAG